LYQAFSAIEQMGSVSQSMLAGGIKVSSITSIYGLVIFILAILLKIGLNLTDKTN
jgi:biopolymer transport protein ExbB/TolQ